MFDEVGEVMAEVQVCEQPNGPGLESTDSGIDETNEAKEPVIVWKCSCRAKLEVSCLVLDWKAGTTQMKTVTDIVIMIRTINTSAIMVLIPLRERRRERIPATEGYYR